MPSGRTHEAVSLLLAFGTGTVLLGWGTRLPQATGLAAGLASTLWLSADLDLPNVRAARRLGPLGVIWKPYEWLLNHRSLVSHSVFFGTIVRVVYVFVLWVVVWSLASVLLFVVSGRPLATAWQDEIRSSEFFWFWLIGLAIGDAVHIALDVIGSCYQWLRKKLGGGPKPKHTPGRRERR